MKTNKVSILNIILLIFTIIPFGCVSKERNIENSGNDEKFITSSILIEENDGGRSSQKMDESPNRQKKLQKRILQKSI